MPASPFFESRTITAAHAIHGLVVIHALGQALYLPPETLVDVVLDGDVLTFIGHFSRVERPSRVRLAPVDAEDARGLIAALASELGLPRQPRSVSAVRLVQARDGELVTVVGLRKAGHRGAPEFEELQLRGDAPTSDGVYRLTGFVYAKRELGVSRDSLSGPTLGVVTSEKLIGAEIVMGRSCAIDVGAEGRWRVLVDGAPVPMTVTEVETATTNAGSYEKPSRPRVDALWIAAPAMLEPGELEVRSRPEGWTVRRNVTVSRVAIYNTVVSTSMWFTLAFPRDLSRVDVTIDEYTDTSS
jgi:hypothetical protein